MDNKLNDSKKENSSIEKVLKTISFLLVLVVALLVLIFFKLNKINKNIVIMSDNDFSEFSTTNDKFNDVIDVFYETTFNVGDDLPLYNEISETSTSATTENIQTDTTKTTSSAIPNNSTKITYVINNNSKKMHYKTCSFVSRMKEENKTIVQLTKDELNNYLNSGYTFCSSCGG